jgi:hypothetical protein
MATKHDSPGSSTGGKGPLRDWSTPSYSATDGRSVSSLADHNGRGSPSTTHVEGASAQIPTAFKGLDAARTQDKTPVRKRPIG